MKIAFFKSASEFREWLEARHISLSELWVGFFKKDSGRAGITYAEAVDEALCFGWIDGLKKRVDDFSYTHRFTPRKPKSNWSRANILRVRRLKRCGRMTPVGLKAFAARDPARSGIYSFENAARELSLAEEKQFKARKTAWNFFQQQAPWYRRTAIWWIVSARRDETRARRLARLIEDSRHQRRLGHLTGTKRS